MKIATYNTYFEPKLYSERFRYIIKTLKEHECAVLCLQEIPTKDLSTVEQILIEFGYYFQYFMTSGTYGIITASQLPWDKLTNKYYSDSLMGRGFIHVQLTIEPKILKGSNGNSDSTINHKKEIHIINTHLESMYQFQKSRDLQLKEIVTYCQDNGIIDNTVICGDLNIAFPKIYTLEKHFTGHVDFSTWFGSRFSNSKRNCRFDRIYTGSTIEVIGKVKVVGDQLIEELECYPSDHDGLIFDISIKQ